MAGAAVWSGEAADVTQDSNRRVWFLQNIFQVPLENHQMLKFGGGGGEKLKIFLSFFDNFNLKVKYLFNQVKYNFFKYRKLY